MGCGDFVDVFSKDPQDMPGQGLARADNYRVAQADTDYGGLLDTYLGENQNQILDAERRFKPQYIEQDTANTGQALGGNLDVLGEYLPQIEATRRASDPRAAQLNDLLLQQAIEEVMAGSNLTPAQQRAAQQQSRVALAARGMGGTNAALADELLAQFDLGEQLKGGRRKFAMSALGLNKDLRAGQTPQDWLQFALGTGRTAGATILPGSASAGLLASAYGENQQNNRVTAGLETQIGMDQADKWNSGLMMGMGAMCWAAREVFGATDLRWLQFRAWLLQRAPEKLRAWYLVNGEAWAERLRTNPLAKRVVKRWMERRIANGSI